MLWLSSFFSNYYFISFGGCFRIFGGSISTSIHWFSCQSVQSADNVNKEKLVWLFILFFMPTFFRCNTPSCAIPKEKHNILNYSFWNSTLVQGSVNQPFIVNKKRGILRGRECPSQLIQTFIQTFNTSSWHSLSHFTKYLWIKLPFKPCYTSSRYSQPYITKYFWLHWKNTIWPHSATHLPVRCVSKFCA